jgi:hypothetical protein
MTETAAFVRPSSDGGIRVLIEEARLHQRRRHRYLALLTVSATVACLVALVASGALFGRTRPAVSLPGHPVRVEVLGAHSPLRLDLFWSVPPGPGSGANVTVNLNTGVVHTAAVPSSIFAIPRKGYLFGYGLNAGVSTSYDLRQTYHIWSGRYGPIVGAVPAADPADLWVSSGTGTATEVNGNEQPVAPTVTIPEGFLVDGQAGPDLVIAGPPPTEMLELWSPGRQQVMATLGSLSFVDRGVVAGGGLVVWADANVLHIAGSDGRAERVVTGPSGDWATSLDISPDGSRIGVVWQPAPGTRDAGAGGVVAIVDPSDGSSVTVPGSVGATDPLAWAPDGSRLFFPRAGPKGTSDAMVSYLIGSHRAESMRIPGLHLPGSFNSTGGAVIVWSTAAKS